MLIIADHLSFSLLIGYCFVVATVFTILFADYSRWQFIDEDDGPGFNLSDKKWHTRRWQMAIAALAAILPFIPLNWFYFIGSFNALLWPLALNKLRNKPWLHVGTSDWDERLGKGQYALFLGNLAISIAVLILTL